MKSYADKRHTTITALVEQYIIHLVAEDKPVDAEQI